MYLSVTGKAAIDILSSYLWHSVLGIQANSDKLMLQVPNISNWMYLEIINSSVKQAFFLARQI